MKEKDKKNPAQVMLTKAEFDIIKVVGITRRFRSVNLYLRSLIEKDVSTMKRSSETPWIFGMRKYDWDNLNEAEKEQFMNQIGPVEPGGIDYLIDKAKGRIMEDLPVVGQNELL